MTQFEVISSAPEKAFDTWFTQKLTCKKQYHHNSPEWPPEVFCCLASERYHPPVVLHQLHQRYLPMQAVLFLVCLLSPRQSAATAALPSCTLLLSWLSTTSRCNHPAVWLTVRSREQFFRARVCTNGQIIPAGPELLTYKSIITHHVQVVPVSKTCGG